MREENEMNVYEIELAKSIRTDISELDIEQVGQPGKFLRNNGIERDGGITNLYETVADESADYDFVFHASNGKRVQIKNGVEDTTGNIIAVDDVKILDGSNFILPEKHYLKDELGYMELFDSFLNGDGSLWVLAMKQDFSIVMRKYESKTLLPLDDEVATTFTYRANTLYRLTHAYMTQTITPEAFQFNVDDGYVITPSGVLIGPTGAYDLAIWRHFDGQYFFGFFGGEPGSLGGYKAHFFPGGGVYPNVRGNYFWENNGLIISTWDFQSNDSDLYIAIYPNGNLNIKNPGLGNAVARTSGLGYTFVQYASQSGYYAAGLSDGLPSYISTNGPFTTPPNVALTLNDGSGGYKAQKTFIHFIDGKPSHLSGFRTGLLTEVGELDHTFQISAYFVFANVPGNPQPIMDQAIIYKDVDQNIILLNNIKNFSSVREISPGVVKVGPFFVLTDEKKVVFLDEGFSALTNPEIQYWTKKPKRLVAAKIEQKNFGTVDIGSFVSDIDAASYAYLPNTPTYSGNLSYRGAYYFKHPYVYENNILVMSPDNRELGSVYVENSRLPIAGPTPVNFLSVDLPQGTALRSTNYNGYEIENILAGEYELFLLFGQIYAFDGNYIWLVPTNAGIVQGSLQRIAPAQGLKYLSSGPEAAYFLTDYDNSLFVFDGGRSLKKIARMNQKAPVDGAIYNTEENALHMITSDSVLILRDNIATENARPFATGKVNLYSTVNGIIYGQGAKWSSLQYKSNVFAAGTTSVLALDVETPFVGPMDNAYYQTSQYYVQFRRPAGGTNMSVTFIYRYLTADAEGTETKTVNLTPADFTAGGYCRVRYIPTVDAVAANSLRIQISEKVVILNVIQYYGLRGSLLVPDVRTAQ